MNGPVRDDAVRGRHPLVGALLSLAITVAVAVALGALVTFLASAVGITGLGP